MDVAMMDFLSHGPAVRTITGISYSLLFLWACANMRWPRSTSCSHFTTSAHKPPLLPSPWTSSLRRSPFLFCDLFRQSTSHLRSCLTASSLDSLSSCSPRASQRAYTPSSWLCRCDSCCPRSLSCTLQASAASNLHTRRLTLLCCP